MLIKLEKFAYVLLCAIMFHCSIFGGGRIVMFGPITFRMLLLILLIIASIPMMLSHFGQIIKNKYFVSVIIFAIWVFITAIIGVAHGHRMHLILSDVKGFMYFVMIPMALSLLTSKKRIHIFMKAIMYANFFAAIASIVLLFLYIYNPTVYHQVGGVLYEAQVIFAGGVSETILRMFYRSAPYLLCGCAFAMYFYMIEKKRFIYAIIAGGCLFAILITYTRSFYLAAGVAALGVIAVSLTNASSRRRGMNFLMSTVIVFVFILVVVGVINRTNYLEFAITRTVTTFTTKTTETNENDLAENLVENEGVEQTGKQEHVNSTEELANDRIDEYIEQSKDSDSLRQDTLNGLWRNIKQSPILGLGLGAEFEERSDGLNEYIYLDIWSKMGIVGLGLYFAPIVLAIKSFLNNKKRLTEDGLYALYSFIVLLGFVSYSLFNPLMNTSLGILYYCCVLAIVNCWEKSDVSNEQGKY